MGGGGADSAALARSVRPRGGEGAVVGEAVEDHGAAARVCAEGEGFLRGDALDGAERACPGGFASARRGEVVGV